MPSSASQYNIIQWGKLFLTADDVEKWCRLAREHPEHLAVLFHDSSLWLLEDSDVEQLGLMVACLPVLAGSEAAARFRRATGVDMLGNVALEEVVARAVAEGAQGAAHGDAGPSDHPPVASLVFVSSRL